MNLLPFLLSLGALFAFTVAPPAAAAQAAPKNGYRIYISVDMEGTAGAASGDELSADGQDYERFRKILTGEVLAAIKGAEEAGATEFVISDSHGSERNLLIEQLPENVTLVRGKPRPLAMMQGIEKGHFDGAIFLGYHASATNKNGLFAHTWSAREVVALKLNGVEASEGLLNAALAGQFGVPVILVTGDDVAVEELRSTIGPMEGVAVKTSIGFLAGEMMAVTKAQNLIREGAKRAVQNIGRYKAAKPPSPVVIDLTFTFYQPAELLSWLPMVERTGARSIRYRRENMADAVKFLEFIHSYSPSLKP